jgi:hypothetical protein
VIVVNERHLKRLMGEYVRYYHDDRTHLTLAKGTPGSREAEKNPDVCRKVVSMPRLGGLHHRYDLAARVPSSISFDRSRGLPAGEVRRQARIIRFAPFHCGV